MSSRMKIGVLSASHDCASSRHGITEEGQIFKHINFRMTDISNLKINERANVQRPTLQKSLQ